MSRARRLGRIFGVLVLVCAVGVTFAGPANARSTKAQKKKAAAKLVKQLKKNPRLIKSKRWLRKAGHVNATLPLTVRLNPVAAIATTGAGPFAAEVASNDSALIDLTSTFGPSVGQKSTTIRGKIEVLATFGNPAEGDDLGDLRINVTSANLSAASVGVLDNPDAVACNDGAGPEPARPGYTLQQTQPVSTLSPAMASFYLSRAAPVPVSNASLAPSVGDATVVRTAPIQIGKADTSRVSNRGKANLFAATNNVRLDLALSARVNTIFRVWDTGLGDQTAPSAFLPQVLPGSLFQCSETFAGTTNSSDLTADSFDFPTSTADIGNPMHQNLIVQRVLGNLNVSPAFTVDGKVRIAKVDVAGEWAHSTIDACLQPNKGIDTFDGLGAFPTPVASPGVVGTGSFREAQTLGAAITGTNPNYFLGSTFPGGVDPALGDALGVTGGPLTGYAGLVTACDAPNATVNNPAWPTSHETIPGSGNPLIDAIEPATARRLELDPEIKVNSVTAEVLIGTGVDY